jgi:hypothetical protein
MIITIIRGMPPSGVFTLSKYFSDMSTVLLTMQWQLPNGVKDVLSSLSRISKMGMASLHAHCHRELFHSCWEILLDEDFLSAYRHRIVLKCADGVVWRVFPHIFTYSADYPEKYVHPSSEER